MIRKLLGIKKANIMLLLYHGKVSNFVCALLSPKLRIFHFLSMFRELKLLVFLKLTIFYIETKEGLLNQINLNYKSEKQTGRK